jgi:hypothetical protein
VAIVIPHRCTVVRVHKRRIAYPREITMKAIGYGRVSKADARGDSTSIEVQRRDCAKHAEANGWELVRLADEGVSGGVAPADRKKLTAALALLRAGEAEALVITPHRPGQPQD